jgi:voltage-dependent potassium channel beta subunit
MKYRALGKSGYRVSVISIGSWLTYGTAINENQSFHCLEAAVEKGINLIDTADVYNRGEAEKVLGNFLKRTNRKELLIATKVFFPMADHWMARGLSHRHIFNACESSLERLKIDYIDLYQCHRYDVDTPLEETCYAMHLLIQKGWIHSWGVSQWSAVEIINAFRICEKHGWKPPVSNQPIYNMLNRSLEVDVMEVCENEGVGLIVFSPLAQGILTGKYKPGEIPPDSRAASEAAKNYFSFKRLNEETYSKIDSLKPIATQLGLTMSQLALAWCLRKAPVTSVIMGASKPEQVIENVKAATVELDPEVITRIEDILDNAPRDQYTGALTGYGVSRRIFALP